MPKKVLDIIPPEQDIIDQEQAEKKFSKLFSFKRILITILVILIIIGGFAYLRNARAEIKIWPKTQPLEFKKALLAETGKELNYSEGVVSAFSLKKETTASKEFSSSKITKEKKAHGIIRVYNNAKTSPITLVANTRFMSASGKVFRTPERVTIPGKKVVNGKWKAGYLDVKVIAAEPGEDYNIEPSKFSLPGLVGSGLYTKVYGESFKAMKGGSIGEVYEVKEEDLEKANQELLLTLKKKAKKEVLEEREALIIPDTITTKVTDLFSSAEAGMETDNFTVQGKAVTKALAIKKSDLKKIVKQFIKDRVKDKKLKEDSLTMTLETENLDLEKEKAEVNLKFTVETYYNIDKEGLKEIIKGGSLAEIATLLERRSDITKVEIKTWPGWLSTFPSNEERIKVKVMFD